MCPVLCRIGVQDLWQLLDQLDIVLGEGFPHLTLGGKKEMPDVPIGTNTPQTLSYVAYLIEANAGHGLRC